MSVTFKRSSTFNALVLAGLLATVGVSATAQGTATPAPASPAVTSGHGGHGGHHMGKHDPAKMQAKMAERTAKRMADLKAKLNITPAQEGAWTSFTTALQPPAGQGTWGKRPTAEQRAEIAKLTTPERIDRMTALRAERMTAMNTAMGKRNDAIKTFYSTLAPEQKKTFDAEHQKMGRRGGGGHHGHHGGMHKG
ncbi:Spy/CpxP family protein refolding chaperone [Polaromonas sp. YR568]|uniref:Spy/CpxP family protein refolding chaperone n=1 Tax=Polaromonas sp. YR568 TaxID=1855301 RepID=UPI0031381242